MLVNLLFIQKSNWIELCWNVYMYIHISALYAGPFVLTEDWLDRHMIYVHHANSDWRSVELSPPTERCALSSHNLLFIEKSNWIKLCWSVYMHIQALYTDPFVLTEEWLDRHAPYVHHVDSDWRSVALSSPTEPCALSPHLTCCPSCVHFKCKAWQHGIYDR